MAETQFTTGTVRVAFVQVWEPKDAHNTGKEKYSMCLIIKKSDEKTVDRINAAVDQLCQDFKTANKGKLPSNYKLPLRDADEDSEKCDNPAFEGCYFMNVTSVRKPKIVDRNIDPILDTDEFFSGCYARVSLNFYSFDTSGNRGIAVGFSNVQKVRDGEHLGGGAVSAEDAFAEPLDDDEFDEF